MPFLCALFLFASGAAYAAEGYFLEYSYYDGLGTKMRRESVIKVGADGVKKKVQTRIFEDATNELREITFVKPDGSTATFGKDNMPDPEKAEYERVRKLIGYRTLVAGDGEKKVSGNLPCVRSSADSVLCEGVLYYREGSRAVQDHGLTQKREPSVGAELLPDDSWEFELPKWDGKTFLPAK